VKVAIDTNMLVRYLTEDDEAQAAAIARIIEAASAVLVSTAVLAETTWDLRRVTSTRPWRWPPHSGDSLMPKASKSMKRLLNRACASLSKEVTSLTASSPMRQSDIVVTVW
jgi:predicted nucleic acid-binding protein